MGNIQEVKSSLIEGQTCIMGEEITIFLLDCSGSMCSGFDLKDYPEENWMNQGSKFQAMCDAAADYAKQRVKAASNGAKDKVGVITFGKGGATTVFEPYNTNYQVMANKVSKIECGGSTPMAEAVEAAIKMSENYPTAFLRLVILSDGQPDSKPYVLEAVQRAYEEYGLVTDTVGIGNKNYNDVNACPCGLDEQFLIQVSELGGGKYTRCTNAEALSQLFLEIEQERALLIGKGVLLLGDGKDIK